MTSSGWIQLLLLLAGLVAITKPMGIFLLRILDPEREGRTFLDPILGPLERLVYKILRVKPDQGQTWWQYAMSLFVFSALTMLVTYLLLRFQDKLPGQALFNPAGLPAVPEHLAFNTAASFVTNTNWQSYGGESTMTYFSQMVALVLQHFFSFSVGVAVAAAIVRAIAASGGRTIGNFWRDIVRLVLYLELPVCILFAAFLICQGTPQNFRPYTQAHALDQSQAVSTTQPSVQSIAQGPVASMVAIKMQGTNGGGYMNANAAHPFEDSTPLSNYIQILIFLSVPTGLTYYLGRMVRNQKHGWAVWTTMFVIFVASTLFCWHFEAAGNPRLTQLGVASGMAGNNMEGKEVRFGVFNSAFFANATTDTGCGAVNSMHDSFTPLGGFIPLLNIQLGEVIFGGTGAGLYGMLIFVFVAIFLAGLMVGRTPEYLGKKIDGVDVKLASLAVLVTAIGVLFPTAAAGINFLGNDWGTAGLNNNGPHGLSEILYCFSEGVGNNGSAFAGLTMNPVTNVVLAFVILVGRYFPMIPILALAGRLVKKKAAPIGPGSFPVTGATFVFLLGSTVLIVGALTFFPVLALGPVLEHFLMHATHTTF
ncbi:MAG TPA: potassium-transporting ATPase subunit KdpA [Phycisphaerae bacterium]|nr:potassium-transporting ATPase subunit KdpA [Phycisphaerae bacterium]